MDSRPRFRVPVGDAGYSDFFDFLASDSEETVRQLQDTQTKQRVYAAQIVQAERDSDSSYDALLLGFKAAVDELARKAESLRASRKAAHWEIFTDRIDTGALLSVRLSANQLYYALDCAKDILAGSDSFLVHWG